MRLKRLKVENFKGLQSFEFAPDGKDAVVRGDNGTGKTSLHDAWSWLLTGKDSSGRADFAVKPLAPDGQRTAKQIEAEIASDRK